MIKQLKLIYLDQYDKEFRKGYDAACVVNSIKESLKAFFEQNELKVTYINIHKDSLSLCQGLCAENLFYSIVKDPDGSETKNENELWLLLKPSKMIKR